AYAETDPEADPNPDREAGSDAHARAHTASDLGANRHAGGNARAGGDTDLVTDQLRLVQPGHNRHVRRRGRWVDTVERPLVGRWRRHRDDWYGRLNRWIERRLDRRRRPGRRFRDWTW
ncbi:MAG TPA: hypothetical protein VIL50_08415, partial [Candidatus Limnocylindrales bacterium]